MEKTKTQLPVKNPALRHLALGLGLLAWVAGCKAPTVNLGTAEPIKVDIDMRLDVYQHSDRSKPATQASPAPQVATADPATRRRNRMADIQTFKNSGYVGEGRDGLVSIQKLPEGEYGDTVRKTVDAENADRLEQMKEIAETRKVPLTEIQKEQATLWRNRAFKGELIEIEVEPNVWKWTAKEG
ncbi:MAG: DUF1318 domain-containing protein [Terrimicrobiaceae bacterium]